MRANTVAKAAAVAVAVSAAAAMSGCASCERMGKSIESNMANGIQRTVVLYDYDGDEIARWDGKMDLQVSSDGGHIVFDLDGRRTVITGGIVVSEETE